MGLDHDLRYPLPPTAPTPTPTAHRRTARGAAARSGARVLAGLAWLLLAAAPAGALTAQGASDAPESGSDAGAPALGGEVIARADGLTVSADEFTDALLIRHGGGSTGDEALRNLAERFLIEELSAEQGIVIDEEALAEGFAELDAEARAAGSEGGLRAELERAGVSLEAFRDTLRLQLALERLVRRDIGIPADRPCPPEQQQLWLDQQVQRAGVARVERPWDEGIAATVGATIGITPREWADTLEARLPRADLRELAFQLLLAKAVERRLPDLSTTGVEAAVEAEVARRRAETEADPAYQGVPFEELLAAQGLSLDLLGRDPAVRIAALSTRFVDQSAGEDGLRAAYEAERDWFEDRFGEAVRTRILYLVAAPERGPLTPRTFADAEQVLRDLARDIETEADFERVASSQSEDPLSRERGGDLGFVVPAAPNVPESLREEIFLAHGAGRSGLVGPIRLDNGVALLWLGMVRPSPPWERMKDNVHRELRRRFLVETLPPESIETVYDPPSLDAER